jgi:hypothetical protein
MLFALTSLAGCAFSERTPSPYAIPGGSRLHLNQALEIAPNTAHINVQFGRPGGVDLLEPFCSLLVSTLSTRPQLIRPGVFRIESVTQRMEPGDTVLSAKGERLRLASLNLAGVRLADADYTSIDYVTNIKLSSARQPQVRRMVCHKVDDVSGGHLSVDEIKGILEPLATIELAP